MAKIRPFPGIRFDLTRNRLSSVISPPYDKIPLDLRKQLWNKDPHNIVRLILPPPGEIETDVATQSTDTEGQDWYSQAADTLKQWKQEGIFVVDPPHFYLYKQTFTYQDQRWTRAGLFVDLRLDDHASPLAHEHTFEGPKADRLKLLCATHTNLSPIFLLADGDRPSWDILLGKTDSLIASVEDEEDQVHELYGISNPETIAQIQSYIQQRTLVIADGHHRFETACNFKRIMMQETGLDPDTQPWGGVMAYIVPISNPGLLVLPTHRVLKNLSSDWLDGIKNQAKSYFEIEPVDHSSESVVRETLSRPEHDSSIIVASKREAFVLKRKSNTAIHVLDYLQEPLQNLNVSILHNFIFQTCLGLSDDFLQANTRYVRGENQALRLIQNGSMQAAFLLAGIPAERVFEISIQGIKMPQKSTDFYPKVPTGLLLRSLTEST